MIYLFTQYIVFFLLTSNDCVSKIQYLKVILSLQILQHLNTKITATKGTTTDSVSLKTKMALDQEDIHLVVEDKKTMLSLLIVHNANCVENMVTSFTSAITDLILLFKAIHLHIVLLYIIHPTTTTKRKLWLHLQLRKIVRHGSLTLGPLII